MKYVPIFLFLIIHCTLISQQSRTDSLENLLPGAEAKEKLELLLALAEAYEKVNVEKAIQYCHQALNLSDSLHDDLSKANAYRFLGHSLTLKGQYEDALKYTRQSRDLFKSLNEEIK